MLTPDQRQALKAFIQGDAEANALYVLGDLTGLADYLNASASPPYTIWRSSVDVNEIMSNGFDWTRVDNATVGKARIWEWMMRQGSINPSKPNIRAGIDEAWSGTGADITAHRAAIYAHCKRLASRVEKVFSTG